MNKCSIKCQTVFMWVQYKNISSLLHTFHNNCQNPIRLLVLDSIQSSIIVPCSLLVHGSHKGEPYSQEYGFCKMWNNCRGKPSTVLHQDIENSNIHLRLLTETINYDILGAIQICDAMSIRSWCSHDLQDYIYAIAAEWTCPFVVSQLHHSNSCSVFQCNKYYED